MNYKEILYIDIGNTLIKMAFYKNNNFWIWKKINSQSILNKEKLIQEFRLKNIDCIVLSSVKKTKTKEFIDISKISKIPLYDIKNLNLSPHFNFIEKKIIGSDIMCGVVASNTYGINNIIISMGTATTISLVIKNKYQGTIIIPGIGISAEALFSKAELLKPFEYKFTKEKFKKNTEHSVNLGIINSAQKLLHCWVEDIKKDNNDIEFNVFLTGGYSNKLDNNILKYKLNEYLVFEGMKKIFDTNR